jgi:hypothetical protein
MSTRRINIPSQVNVTYPTVCDDISTQFDGLKCVFQLRLDQDYINNIADSRNLQIIMGRQILAPYVKETKYPWITEYDSHKGFRVRGSNVTIYNAPDVGDYAVTTVIGANPTPQVKKYPYSASTIALGD